jgi:hypothetical protein
VGWTLRVSSIMTITLASRRLLPSASEVDSQLFPKSDVPDHFRQAVLPVFGPSEAGATDTSRNILPGPCIVGHKAAEGQLPYIYIDKVFHELRSELLSAMHSALEAQGRKGQVDVDRLYRAFTRAAAGKCATPQRVSEKCVVETMTSKPRKAKDARIDD